MTNFGKKQQTAMVLVDIILLLAAPVVFDLGVAVTVFFLFPLPAIIVAFVFHKLPGNVTAGIERVFVALAVIARFLLALIIALGVLKITIPVVGVSEAAFTILFLRTYSNYFFAKYGPGLSGEKLAKYILELYILILFYIAAILALGYIKPLFF